MKTMAEAMREAHEEFERVVGRRYTLTNSQLELLRKATDKDIESVSIYIPVDFDTTNDELVVKTIMEMNL